MAVAHIDKANYGQALVMDRRMLLRCISSPFGLLTAGVLTLITATLFNVHLPKRGLGQDKS
jgi:hypothetical protein